MDPLENKIRTQLNGLRVGELSLLETDIIDSLEIKEKTTYIHLLLTENLQNITELQNEITSSLKELVEIEEVKFSISKEKKAIKNKRETIPKSAQSSQPKNSSFLQNYKNILVVASGKGGVGKSTVALNLALSLQKQNFKVALFDADIYGPSIPLMMGMRNQKPDTVGEKIVPLNNFGIEFMSIGNLVGEGDTIVWRGPMVHQAINQLLRDTSWSGGDFIIIDLPPGTGDVQISISQITSITGAIIVCTPQDLALIDARRAMAMFEKVNIPILGIIENMSFFLCPKCGTQTNIFSNGGAQQESENLKFPFLGNIPLDLKIREGGDKGKPIMSQKQTDLDHYYFSITNKLKEILKY